MQTTLLTDHNRIILKVSGALTFVDNKNWRAVAMELIEKDAGEHVLDLTDVEDIDSAGLGMMLALQKWAEDKGYTLKLKFDPDSMAGRMIKLSKFDDMFETLC